MSKYLFWVTKTRSEFYHCLRMAYLKICTKRRLESPELQTSPLYKVKKKIIQHFISWDLIPLKKHNHLILFLPLFFRRPFWRSPKTSTFAAPRCWTSLGSWPPRIALTTSEYTEWIDFEKWRFREINKSSSDQKLQIVWREHASYFWCNTTMF